MPLSQLHIHRDTPMGANLVADGATFRVWAPAANEVYLLTTHLEEVDDPGFSPSEDDKLVRQDGGHWTGFGPGLADGSLYLFWVDGEAGAGPKRDPYARELTSEPAFPKSYCIIRDPNSYPWNDAGYQPPRFRDLVIYQFHFGVFWAVDEQGRDVRETQGGRFLDVLDRMDYLKELGVNAIQPLPIQEYPSQFSMGYNGTDYFSPEMDYQVEDPAELDRFLAKANDLLSRHGRPPLTREQLAAGPNQLKAVVDICHLNGIAVIFDLVYNHAGGGFDPASLYFFDRQQNHSNNDSLYFTDKGWAGGLVFAYWKDEVRQFLIDNAKFCLDDYHIDGIRYDEVSVIDDHGGWYFTQDLTGTVRSEEPQAIQVAEYWKDRRWLAVHRPDAGLGFDAALGDGLRKTLRGAISQAAHGMDAPVDLDSVAASLDRPYNFPAAWQTVQCVENHDIVYNDRPDHEFQPRVASLADNSDARSWYARSRSRAAMGLVMTAPGIPMMFTGQEFLEYRNWSDNPGFSKNTLTQWDRLENDSVASDFLQFTRDAIGLRRGLPALRDEAVNVFHVHNQNRVLAFHRWVEGAGEDVVVVMSLNDSTFWDYALGFPGGGRWREVFNSDYYDNYPNPWVAGNAGGIDALGSGRHGLPASANIVIPANSVLVFAR